MSGRYYTPSQVARRYGIHPDTVLRMIRRGQIRALRIPGLTKFGDRYHILEAELSVFEETCSTRRSRPERAQGQTLAR